MLHSHHHRPLSFMRRYFDEYRGLREVLGHVEPRQVRATCARAAPHERRPGLARVTGCSRAPASGGRSGNRGGTTLSGLPVRYSVRGRTASTRLYGAGCHSKAGRHSTRSTYLEASFSMTRSAGRGSRSKSKRRVLGISSPRLQAAGRRVPTSHHGRPGGPLTIAWVVPPWGVGSGVT